MYFKIWEDWIIIRRRKTKTNIRTFFQDKSDLGSGQFFSPLWLLSQNPLTSTVAKNIWGGTKGLRSGQDQEKKNVGKYNGFLSWCLNSVWPIIFREMRTTTPSLSTRWNWAMHDGQGSVRGLGHKHNCLWVIVVVWVTETRQGYLALYPWIGSAEGHWSDIVGRQAVKRHIIARLWRPPFSESAPLALKAEQLITGEKTSCLVHCQKLVSSCLLGAYSMVTPIVTTKTVYRYCQIPGRMRTPLWLTNPSWKLVTWASHQEEAATGSMICALSWGLFRDKWEQFLGCMAEWWEETRPWQALMCMDAQLCM